MEPSPPDLARRRVAFSMQNYWVDEASCNVHISPPSSSLDARAPSKPSILTRISSSLAASPPAQLFSKFRLRTTEPPPSSETAPSLRYLPMPTKTPQDASAAAAEILAAVTVLECNAAAAAANLQQLVSHLNEHTQRCTILSLPHAGVIKEAAAASAFYSHQSAQAVLDFIASYEELLNSARPLKETAETVKTIKHALNRFEVYADQVLAVPEAES